MSMLGNKLRKCLKAHGESDIYVSPEILCQHTKCECCGANVNPYELMERINSKCEYCGESVVRGVWFCNPEQDFDGYLSISYTEDALYCRESER